MTLKDYQYINSLETGTTYYNDIIKYFGVDTDKDIDVVNELATSLLEVETKPIPEDYILVINGKKYMIEKEFNKREFKKFERLDALLAENNNIQNLNHLLAIYIRPVKRKWFKNVIEPYDVSKQEQIAKELLSLDAGIALGCMVFFYQSAQQYLKNGNIFYLNQKKSMKLRENLQK